MYIIEGLQMERGTAIERSLHGILRFLEEELTLERKTEFLTRKYKDSKQFVSIGFDSISPVQLSIQTVYSKKDTRTETILHNDIFQPLFYGYSITNKQYKKLEGAGTEKLDARNNINSFSDYFISKKVLDTVLPRPINLTPHQDIHKESLKYDVVSELYRIFNEQASQFAAEGSKKVGFDFFVDFNSILDLDIPQSEKEQFVTELLRDTGIEADIPFSLLETNRDINGVMYLLDSIHFQAKTLFKLDVMNQTLEQLLSQEVNINFEVPTKEKPTLHNTRSSDIAVGDELPKLSLLELVLLRYLVVTINKQGKHSSSGYWFHVRYGNDTTVSLERKIQIISDQQGNLAINGIDYTDIKKEQALKQKIKERFRHYFNEDIPLTDSLQEFESKLYAVKISLALKQDTEKELIDDCWAKKDYKKIGKILSDGAYRNIDTRVMAYEKKFGKHLHELRLYDLLFVIDVLYHHNQTTRGRLEFMNTRLRTTELLKKEILTSEEIHYVLGGLAALVIDDANNKKALAAMFMRQNRTIDIIGKLNKRIEIRVSEIKNLHWVAQRMRTVVSQLDMSEGRKRISNEDKFSFTTGLLSGLQVTEKDKNKEGNKENSIPKGDE